MGGGVMMSMASPAVKMEWERKEVMDGGREKRLNIRPQGAG